MSVEPSDETFQSVERELAVLLRRGRSFAGSVARELHPDLEPAAYGLLSRIADLGGARATELADYFAIDKAAVSRQVRILERLGFITRRRDETDARAYRLVGTEAGLARLRETRSARQAQLRRQLTEWAERDVAEFASLLSRFNTLDISGRSGG